MAITTAVVAQTTPTAIYTSSGATAITWASFTNYTGGAATLTLYVVPNLGSATTQNMIVNAESIAATDTFGLYAAGEKLLLENGDAIYAFSDTATAVNAVISYASI
jgi:hypothetical protein